MNIHSTFKMFIRYLYKYVQMSNIPTKNDTFASLYRIYRKF